MSGSRGMIDGMDGAALFRRTAAGVNRLMIPALRTAPGRRLLGGSMAVVTYRGRKSGRQFTFPVSYRRSGSEVTIGIAAPEAKTWWRNFLGEGAPMSLQLGEEQVEGHAVATRDDVGKVVVKVVI